MKALGIDPGLAHLGWAIVDVGDDGARVLALGCIQTAKDKRKVLSTVDLHRRGQEIARALGEIVRLYPGISVAFAESLSFVRSASTMCGIGRAWGVVDAVLEANRIGLVQASPQEIKQVVCGSKTATKDDVEAAVIRVCGEHVRTQLARITKSRREHPVDAVAAVLACIDRPELRIARGLDRQRSLPEVSP